jgi:hypothetical protein
MSVVPRSVWVCLLCATPFLQAQFTASDLSDRARKAEKKGDVVSAYLLYAQAAALDPQDRTAWGRSLALRTQAALKAKVLPPDPTSGELTEDAADALNGITDKDIREADELRAPVRLKPNANTSDFKLQGDSRSLWEQVAKAYGLQVIFDADYQPVSNVRFRMESVAAGEAFTALELATASFFVPVSDRMLMVARDSVQKRQELEHTIAVSVPIPEPVTVQEAQELARSVQQLMDIQKFGIDSVRRIVVIKDRISRVIPALGVLRQLLHHRPEVMLEVEFVEVVENSALDYGLRLPTSFGIAWFGKLFSFQSVPTIPEGFTNFLAFGGGRTLFGIGVTGAEAFATFSKGQTRNLITAQLRALDGQAAQFHVGDKYPILTTGYFGTTEGTGQVYTPPPAFNFEDLGVVLKVTPKVHGWDEMSLEIDAEYKVLTGEALNGIPIIANRKFQSRTRVRAGEWAVLAGLVRASEARNITGIAGLAGLPVIGALFRQNSKTVDNGQTLFVIKPHLLSPPLSEVITRPLWTGTETRGRPAL